MQFHAMYFSLSRKFCCFHGLNTIWQMVSTCYKIVRIATALAANALQWTDECKWSNPPPHIHRYRQASLLLFCHFWPNLGYFWSHRWCNIDCLKMLHSFRSDAVRIFQMLSSFKFARIHFVAKKPGQFTIDGTWKRRPPYQGGQTGEVYNDFRFARVAGYLHSSEVLDRM